MTAPRRSVLERIRPHLAERYTFARPIGRGGMATVFLALDLRHQRNVAIKVLHPELAASLIAQRFTQEIRIAAEFAHPHILPVFDSGEADGIPYYVMPYIEGETLRARLDRTPALDVDEAIRIAVEVADALAYAHARGVVHRDIKPENILLHAGHALVADFGIARGIDAATGGAPTTAGIVVGSPHYMSPEQATAARHIDGRSDIYSLGCVLYEMLTGSRPFGGESPRAILAAHTWSEPPAMTGQSGEVPATTVDAVMRALAKEPDERFATAREFADALSATQAGRAVPLPRPHRYTLLAAVVGVAAVIAVAVALRDRGAADSDGTRIAIFPFTVTGDSSHAYLRDGLAELLATRLGALDGVRPLDTRVTIAEWRRRVPNPDAATPGNAAGVAQGLGTRRFVLGSVVASPSGHLAVSVALHGAGPAPVQIAVDGPGDSLFALVDRLSVSLVASRQGEPSERLSSLTSTSLPAVREYLAGREAWRRGAGDQAIRHYSTALELDSTFALAALGMAASGAWSQQASQGEALRRGLRTGYALRDRLSRRDRLLFEAYVLPESPDGLTASRQLGAWREAAAAAPDSPEAQYEYGDRLYHAGAHVGIANARALAFAAFSRALALDRSHAQAVAHLAEIVALRGGLREADDLRDNYRRLAPAADAAPYVEWRVASARVAGSGRALTGRADSIPLFSLNRIIGFGLLEGRALVDVDAAAGMLRQRVDSHALGPPRVHPAQSLHSWAANRGRTDAVRHSLEVLRAAEPIPPGSSIVYPDADIAPVLDALFWDGDSVTAHRAVARLRGRTTGPPPAAAPDRARYFSALCTTLLWSRLRGETRDELAARAYLRSGTEPSEPSIQYGGGPRLCAAMIEAIDANARDFTPVARLDSMMVTAPFQFGVDFGNLVLARLHEGSGDHAAALRAVQRRPYDWDTGPLYLTTFLREEGRLAARIDDRATAIRAYTEYLALREGSDPAYRAVDDAIRRSLDALRP